MRPRPALAAVLLAALGVGCAVQSQGWRTEDMTAEESTAVSAAAAEWSSYGRDIAMATDGEGVVRISTTPCGDATNQGCHAQAGGAEYIIIADMRSSPEWLETLRMTALHEFGHSLGLHDTIVPGMVMCVWHDRAAPHVTVADLEM